MANQTLAVVPPDVAEPIVLRRFLSRLVEQLDVLVGNRASEPGRLIGQDQVLEASQDLIRDIEQARALLERALSEVDDLPANVALDLLNRMDAIENNFTSYDNRLDAVEVKNGVQDNRLEANELSLADLDSRLTVLEDADFVPEAPNDGKLYGRKGVAWVEIV